MPQGACCCNLYLNALTSQEGEDVPQRGMLYFYLNALTSQEGEDAPPKACCCNCLFRRPFSQYCLREVMVAQIGQFLHRFVIRKAIGFHHIGIVAKAPHI